MPSSIDIYRQKTAKYPSTYLPYPLAAQTYSLLSYPFPARTYSLSYPFAARTYSPSPWRGSAHDRLPCKVFFPRSLREYPLRGVFLTCSPFPALRSLSGSRIRATLATTVTARHHGITRHPVMSPYAEYGAQRESTAVGSHYAVDVDDGAASRCDEAPRRRRSNPGPPERCPARTH